MTSSLPNNAPIPLDLRVELSDPWIPWHLSDRLFGEMKSQASSQPYKKVQVLPTDDEWRFVWRYFHHDKPTKYGIKRIYCVHERHQVTTFESTLSSIEREAETFKADWQKEPRADQRAAVMERWKQITGIFSPFQTLESDGRKRDWKHTKVLPLWHGSSPDKCASISTSGFVYFGKTSLGGGSGPKSTDEGFFGSGIYFTNSARYASDIYSKGHILMAWVSMREPFPVVGDPQQIDMNGLKGKGAYKAYNAHYVPVISVDPQNPTCAVYYPCKVGETPSCDEIVVFHKSQALPRFWVELEVELPYLLKPSEVPLFVSELIPHLLKALQNPQVDRDQKLRNVLNEELAILLKMKPDDDLEEKHTLLFQQLAELIDSTGKVNKTVRQSLTSQLLSSSSQSTPPPALFPTPTQKQEITPSLQSSSSLISTPPISPIVSTHQPSALPSIAFGVAKWKEYFGEVGVEPPLPADIEKILQSPCPFWSGKKVQETHLLVLIPQTVDGKPLTLRNIGDLVKAPKRGNKTKYDFFWNKALQEHGDRPAPASHWVLMTRDILPGSRNMGYEDQCKLVDSCCQKSGLSYQVPNLLDATVAIFLEYITTGTRLYLNSSLTYTRCQEKADDAQLVVGGFSTGGLSIDGGRCWHYLFHGVGCLQKL